jgi:predicted DNA-binding transcriptional regulator AlpA
MTTQPRLLSGPDAAAYLGLTPAAIHKWVAEGRIPKPLHGTRRWDRKAIDLALDNASAIPSPSIASADDECPLEKWMREDEARQQLGREKEWERKYEARKAAGQK